MLANLEKVLILVLLFLIAALFSTGTAHSAGPAGAAEPQKGATPQKTYQYERADCNSGLSGPDKTTCLREAGAALQEAKSGKLADANTDFEGNRIARCGYLREPDKGYCVRRMNGEGTVSGSVEGGGILRELVVIVPE